MTKVRMPRWLPVVWLSLSALLLALDYATGPVIRFPVLLLVPVMLVAWFHARRWALVLAVVLSLPRIYLNMVWATEIGYAELGINAAVRMVLFVLVALMISVVVRQKRELEREVAVLRGILPICMFCKRIRNDDGEWEPVEKYISHHSEAEFSHGMCEECAKEHYPNVFAR